MSSFNAENGKVLVSPAKLDPMTGNLLLGSPGVVSLTPEEAESLQVDSAELSQAIHRAKRQAHPPLWDRILSRFRR